MRSGLLFSALALAALLPVYAAPHVNFLDFSHTGKPAGVQHATGYPLPVVEYAWRKYGSELIRQVYRYEGFPPSLPEPLPVGVSKSTPEKNPCFSF